MEIAKASALVLSRLTDSALPSEKLAVAKPASMVPKTMDDCRALQRWVEFGKDIAPATVTRDQLTRHLEFLASTLPSKAVDVDAGRDRVAVYFRILSGHTEAAIAFMSKRVCEELDWFPSPHQCLAILGRYRAPMTDRDIARGNCQAFLQTEMEAFHRRLEDGPVDQAVIDAQPEQWKRIAENRWLLRREGSGFVQRLKAVAPREDVAA